MSSQAKMAGSSEYVTPLYVFFLVTMVCNIFKTEQNTVRKKFTGTQKYEFPPEKKKLRILMLVQEFSQI